MAEIGLTWLQAKEYQEFLGIDRHHPKLEEASKNSTHSLRGDAALLTPLFWTSDLQQLRENTLLFFQAPQFVVPRSSSPRKVMQVRGRVH